MILDLMLENYLYMEKPAGIRFLRFVFIFYEPFTEFLECFSHHIGPNTKTREVFVNI